MQIRIILTTRTLSTSKAHLLYQGRSKPLKTGGGGGGGGTSEREASRGARLLEGSGRMLPRKILKISLSENVFHLKQNQSV